MVQRTFLAFDSESLVVDSSPNGSLVGNPIINNSDTPNQTVFTYQSGSGELVTLDDTDGGNAQNRFDDDDRFDHQILDGAGLVEDGTFVESESRIDLRALDANGNPTGPTINIYVLSKDGDFTDVWGFAALAPLEDGVQYVKVSGSNNGTSFYSDYITCFAAGTMIQTAQGARAVENLRPGDEVWTFEDGLQPVLWSACSRVVGLGRFAPVHIAAGSLGNSEDLLVSQQHRICVENAMAELFFGQASVLVAAKHLCGLPGIDIRPCPEITYAHFMFDRHRLVRAAGVLSESFFLSENSVVSVDEAARVELRAIFSDKFHTFDRYGSTAVPTLTAREAKVLLPHLS